MAVPNRMLSSSVAGIAAQFWEIKRGCFRLLAVWMAWAISSLPVPDSPVIRTEELVLAIRGILRLISLSPWCSVMMSSMW